MLVHVADKPFKIQAFSFLQIFQGLNLILGHIVKIFAFIARHGRIKLGSTKIRFYFRLIDKVYESRCAVN